LNTTTKAEAQAMQVIAAGHNRSKYIGGSDIAAVLGISPWKTPLDLWRDKTAPKAEGLRKQVLTRGIRWESVVAEMLVERLQSQGHAVEIVGSNTRYQDQSLPFLAAEIDFEIILNGADEITNVELKTVHPFKSRDWGESGSDDLPVHYTAQVMHGLGVTRRRSAYLAALFGADELRVYPVAADDETIEALRQRAKAFWQDHVLTGIAPEAVNLADLAKLFPAEVSDRPALLADEQLTAKVLRMRAINAEIKAREAEAESLEFDIKQAMRDAGELVMPNGKTAIAWVNKAGKYIDEAALKEQDPKLHKALQRTWEKRIFTLKNFSIEGI
jgi:putative phage-type endonuclease